MKQTQIIEIKTYEEKNCLELVRLCQKAYEGEKGDSWRAGEWPFASKEAALLEYASLSLSDQDHFPWNACAIIARRGIKYQTIGLITLSGHGFTHGFGWIGTYIAPPYRGQGIQKLAKETLFNKLSSSISGLYALIHANNTSSLTAALKLPYVEIIPASELNRHPSVVRQEYWKQNKDTAIVYYNLAHFRN